MSRLQSVSMASFTSSVVSPWPKDLQHTVGPATGPVGYLAERGKNWMSRSRIPRATRALRSCNAAMRAEAAYAGPGPANSESRKPGVAMRQGRCFIMKWTMATRCLDVVRRRNQKDW